MSTDTGNRATQRAWPIRVRIARPEDRDAVLAFATTTWNGHDYIPEVWDDWIVPSSGVVLVATVEPPLGGGEPLDADGAPLDIGQPIAMTRVSMLSADEAWLEGIRVDPRVRGLGVATHLQVAEFRWLAAHRARVVRYVTGESNVGSQRLGARHGLVEIGRWRSYAWRERPDVEDLAERRVQLESALSRIDKGTYVDWPRFRDDPGYAAAHGLYEYRSWAYQELTEERFRRHVERQEVLAGGDGEAWAGVIINRHGLSDGTLRASFAAGDGGAAIALLVAAGRPEVRLTDPDPPLLQRHEEAFRDAGYTPWEQASIVVERRIEPGEALPDADDPRMVVLGDDPRAVAVPPVLRA